MIRNAKIDRITNETDIKLVLNLDGSGKSTIKTGIPFFDHMLDQFTFHSQIDLNLDAKGDLGIDCHHTSKIVAFVWEQHFQTHWEIKKELIDTGSFCFLWTML